MQDKENIEPCEIKYAVPSYYDIYKSGGSTLKDDQRGMRLMLDYFSEYFTEEQLQANMQRYTEEKHTGTLHDKWCDIEQAGKFGICQLVFCEIVNKRFEPYSSPMIKRD